MQIPHITTQQMVEVDRLMIEEYGIQLIQMMENAGRNLAELSRRMLGGEVRGKRIALLCGAGNNGGGGMVAARHLHNWGAEIVLKVLPGEEKLKNVPAHQFHILEKMGILDWENIDLDSVDLVIDAMIGYGLTGDPREPIADWIQRLNDADRPVLALDTPSGLDTTTGIPGNPCVRATATMTLALPKSGLMTTQAKPFVGALYLADIGVPPELYAAPSLGLNIGHIFIQDTIESIA
ncbi:MAG: NAD(P)H-hydrate epimerase [Anaerolineales bacterium]|nr:NAD(P)H-hydrate epimerase [Anaerolineales bacterium]